MDAILVLFAVLGGVSDALVFRVAVAVLGNEIDIPVGFSGVDADIDEVVVPDSAPVVFGISVARSS